MQGAESERPLGHYPYWFLSILPGASAGIRAVALISTSAPVATSATWDGRVGGVKGSAGDIWWIATYNGKN